MTRYGLVPHTYGVNVEHSNNIQCFSPNARSSSILSLRCSTPIDSIISSQALRLQSAFPLAGHSLTRPDLVPVAPKCLICPSFLEPLEHAVNEVAKAAFVA